MEKNEISIHEVSVWNVLKKNRDKWLTNRQIAQQIEKISERCVRAHTLKLVKLGLIDLAEIFPAHRFRKAAQVFA